MSKVTCCALSQLKDIAGPNDINLFIVRNPKSNINSVSVFQYLAPSHELYTFYLKNKDSEGWWNVYKGIFQKELQSTEKQLGLALVRDYVHDGFNVNLICYCSDYKQCHRSLVAEELRKMGVEVDLL